MEVKVSLDYFTYICKASITTLFFKIYMCVPIHQVESIFNDQNIFTILLNGHEKII